MRREKSKQHVMSILLSMHLIAKKRVRGEKKRREKNVVISDGTLFVNYEEKKKRRHRVSGIS